MARHRFFRGDGLAGTDLRGDVERAGPEVSLPRVAKRPTIGDGGGSAPPSFRCASRRTSAMGACGRGALSPGGMRQAAEGQRLAVTAATSGFPVNALIPPSGRGSSDGCREESRHVTLTTRCAREKLARQWTERSFGRLCRRGLVGGHGSSLCADARFPAKGSRSGEPFSMWGRVGEFGGLVLTSHRCVGGPDS